MRGSYPVGSIQARLFRFLMISLLGLLILSGLVTWFVAYRVANEAYDHALLDPVMDIVQNVRQDPAGPSLTLSPREQEALLFDGSDRVFFQVRSPSGQMVRRRHARSARAARAACHSRAVVLQREGRRRTGAHLRVPHACKGSKSMSPKRRTSGIDSSGKSSWPGSCRR